MKVFAPLTSPPESSDPGLKPLTLALRLGRDRLEQGLQVLIVGVVDVGVVRGLDGRLRGVGVLEVADGTVLDVFSHCLFPLGCPGQRRPRRRAYDRAFKGVGS